MTLGRGPKVWTEMYIFCEEFIFRYIYLDVCCLQIILSDICRELRDKVDIVSVTLYDRRHNKGGIIDLLSCIVMFSMDLSLQLFRLLMFSPKSTEKAVSHYFSPNKKPHETTVSRHLWDRCPSVGGSVLFSCFQLRTPALHVGQNNIRSIK